MIAAISAGLVMGFGASLTCMANCVPILVPVAASAEYPSIKKGIGSGALFSLGRLLSLVVLLAIFITIKEIATPGNSIIAIATLASGLILMVSSLSVLGVLNMVASSRLLCRYVSTKRSPLYLGILTGIRPCGPLLAALAYILALPKVVEMGVFLLFFWLASSLLIIAAGAISSGMAQVLGKGSGSNRIRRIFAIAMFVIGLILVLQAIGLLLY